MKEIRHRFNGTGALAWWASSHYPHSENLGLQTQEHASFVTDFYFWGNGGAHFSTDGRTGEVEYEEIHFTLPAAAPV